MTVFVYVFLLLLKMCYPRNLLCVFLFCLTLARTDLRYLIRFIFHVFFVFLFCSGGGIICSNHTFCLLLVNSKISLVSFIRLNGHRNLSVHLFFCFIFNIFFVYSYTTMRYFVLLFVMRFLFLSFLVGNGA